MTTKKCEIEIIANGIMVVANDVGSYEVVTSKKGKIIISDGVIYLYILKAEIKSV